MDALIGIGTHSIMQSSTSIDLHRVARVRLTALREAVLACLACSLVGVAARCDDRGASTAPKSPAVHTGGHAEAAPATVTIGSLELRVPSDAAAVELSDTGFAIRFGQREVASQHLTIREYSTINGSPRLSTQTARDGLSATNSDEWHTEYHYNDRGLIEKEECQARVRGKPAIIGSTKVYVYDDNGKVLSAVSSMTSIGTDGNPRRSTIEQESWSATESGGRKRRVLSFDTRTSEISSAKTWEFDASERLLCQQEYDQSGNETHKYVYTYDGHEHWASWSIWERGKLVAVSSGVSAESDGSLSYLRRDFDDNPDNPLESTFTAGPLVGGLHSSEIWTRGRHKAEEVGFREAIKDRAFDSRGRCTEETDYWKDVDSTGKRVLVPGVTWRYEWSDGDLPIEATRLNYDAAFAPPREILLGKVTIVVRRHEKERPNEQK